MRQRGVWFHQLSPYIGKIKSSIAGELIERFSKPGDLVVDPFQVPGRSRRGDLAWPPGTSCGHQLVRPGYCQKPKLCPPRQVVGGCCILAGRSLAPGNPTSQTPSARFRIGPALLPSRHVAEVLNLADRLPPSWQRFPDGLFALVFLHHHVPGFLGSYPTAIYALSPGSEVSSAPVPGDVCAPYSLYKTASPQGANQVQTVRTPRSWAVVVSKQYISVAIVLPFRFGALITSPPYMNALDYGRDNRLRLWFIDPSLVDPVDNDVTQRRQAFIDAITSLAGKVEQGLRRKGYCVFVVGEEFKRSFDAHPSEAVLRIMREQAPSLHLKKVIADKIPDVRRTRHECKGVKTEHFLVFQRN